VVASCGEASLVALLRWQLLPELLEKSIAKTIGLLGMALHLYVLGNGLIWSARANYHLSCDFPPRVARLLTRLLSCACFLHKSSVVAYMSIYTPVYIKFNFSHFARWLLISGVMTPLGVLAQERATISGTVGSAVEGGAAPKVVTVMLHRATDSVMVKTEFANQQGAFQLEAAAGERYLVSVAQVGFKRYWSPAFEHGACAASY
jgi:hypothetical protein